MKEMEADQLWCPMGRISIQQVENGRLAAVQSGAFNQVLPVSGTGAGARVYLSSTCVGSKCPYYRRGFNPWGWGRCALAVIDYRPWLTVAITLAFGFLALWWLR